MYTFYDFNVTAHPALNLAAVNSHLDSGSGSGSSGNVSFAILTTSIYRTYLRTREYGSDAAPKLIMDLELVASSLYGAPSPRPSAVPTSSAPSAAPTTPGPTPVTWAPTVSPTTPRPTTSNPTSNPTTPRPTTSNPTSNPTENVTDGGDGGGGGSESDDEGAFGGFSDTELVVVSAALGAGAVIVLSCVAYWLRSCARADGGPHGSQSKGKPFSKAASGKDVVREGVGGVEVALSPIRKHHDNPMRLIDPRFAAPPKADDGAAGGGGALTTTTPGHHTYV
mmetsp:Transcript_9777/g.17511  ORF Transcript_9777/g.17511 Transcript_9777/m.17511 type:complete len:280 (-) Transcript_9777:6-845(-)